MEIVDDRTGRGVELPLHQPVLCSQLQHLVDVKDALERWPATVLVRPEDHRQFKRGGDTGVRLDAAHRLQAVFTLHVDLDGGAAEATGLIGRRAHHVLADLGGHVVGQQQHLAVEGGGLGLRQAALKLAGDVLLEEPLLVLQASVQAVD